MKAYLISGLGADEKVFSKLKLPKGYESVFLGWIPPLPDEPLSDYAKRFALRITDDHNFILIGMSFGGMLASEIAKITHPKKIIIISSVAKADELPWYFHFAGKFQLQKIVPISLMKIGTILNRVMSASTPEEKALLYEYVRKSDATFIRWSLTEIVNWKHPQRVPNLVHIHGDKDRLLPIRLTKADYPIHNGGHLAVFRDAGEVNSVINSLLSAN